MPNQTKPWRPFGTLLVLLAYGIVRNRVYHYFPVRSLENWFVRDTWMTLPRFAACLAIFCIWSGWKTSATAVRPASALKCLIVSCGAISAWFLYFSGSSGERFTTQMELVGIFTSAVVALFEEYAFRGPLLADLRRRFSARRAIVITSLLFTIYHYQAQSLQSWPSIFLTGVTFAGLRCLGLRLRWLILLHTVIDAGFCFFPSENPPAFTVWSLTRDLALLICALVVYTATPKTPGIEQIQPDSSQT